MQIFLFLILLFLFSFKANSEVVNLKLLCKGTFDATNKSGTITSKSNDVIISIKDNVLQDRNYIKLKVLEDKIFRMIDDSPNKLGREEGRVLRSQWMKFAITKWCTFEVKKKELSKLTDEEVDILAQAFKSSLMQTKSIKNIDQVIG